MIAECARWTGLIHYPCIWVNPSMPQSNRMDLPVYEQLLAVNAGFEQVRRALAALGQREGFERGEIARFGAIAQEARAAIASYVTNFIEMG